MCMSTNIKFKKRTSLENSHNLVNYEEQVNLPEYISESVFASLTFIVWLFTSYYMSYECAALTLLTYNSFRLPFKASKVEV